MIEAIAAALSAPLSNRGPDNPAQRNAEQIVLEARAAMADYLGGDSDAASSSAAARPS